MYICMYVSWKHIHLNMCLFWLAVKTLHYKNQLNHKLCTRALVRHKRKKKLCAVSLRCLKGSKGINAPAVLLLLAILIIIVTIAKIVFNHSQIYNFKLSSIILILVSKIISKQYWFWIKWSARSFDNLYHQMNYIFYRAPKQ